MISDKMQKALNEQINKEFYSAYLYLGMAAYFQEANLGGFSRWMRLQAQEEQAHALKIFDYIFERRGSVKLQAIDLPPTKWSSPLAVFKEVFKHETVVTKSIHNLVELAAKERDHAAVAFLQWFVNEQVEEESNADEIVTKLEMACDAPGALLMLDRELGKRGQD